MKIAIIDGNGLAYGIYSRFKDSPSGLLTNSVGLPTTIVFGFLRSLHKLVERLKFDKAVVCWDVTGSKYRRSIYPEYKQHRDHKDMGDYFAELDACREYFKVFGINQAIARGIEADDVIAWLAKKFNKKDNVVIISNDKDFFQLVRKGIKIYRPIKDEFVNSEWVRTEFGLRPKYMALLQALMGDKVDNIPGIRGIGPATASKLINEYGTTVEELVKNCDHKRWGEIIKENADNLKVYFNLTKLRTRTSEYDGWEYERLKKAMKKAKYDKKPKLRQVLRLKEDLEIQRIDIAFILRRIGVDIQGKVKRQKESEIKV